MYNKKNLKNLALNLSSTSPSKNEDTMQQSTNNLYSQGPACILPNLYLGAFYNALNIHQLTERKINCIINVASEIKNTVLLNGITYHHIQWTHCQNNLASVEFDKAIQTILKAHEQDQVVLIHCHQGIERSAALVLAFLLYSTRKQHPVGKNWMLDDALNFVKKKAPIRPNMELLYQLREYQQSLDRKHKHNIQTRTRRSSSVTGSQPTTLSNSQKVTFRRSRSTSLTDTSYFSLYNDETIKPQVTKEKHALVITLVLLSAMNQQSSSTKSPYLYSHLITDSDKKNNSHLDSVFYKTVYSV